jgi:hypothetical protein
MAALTPVTVRGSCAPNTRELASQRQWPYCPIDKQLILQVISDHPGAQNQCNPDHFGPVAPRDRIFSSTNPPIVTATPM